MASLGTYSIRVPAGLEDLVAEDLENFLGCSDIKRDHRTLFVTTDLEPETLSNLRGVDDVFVITGIFKGLSKERASLQVIESQLSSFSLSESISICSSIREVNLGKGFSITASFVGKRNYNRWEIAEKARISLSRQLGEKYLDSKDRTLPDHDLHIRIHLSGDGGWCGIRLNKSPLFRRDYKTEHLKGSLTPQVAYWMVRLSEASDGDSLLDPMCGAGTILIEAALYNPKIKAIGVDISRDALEAARENSKGIASEIIFMEGDATELPMDDKSINCISSDLPWGLQTSILEGSEAQSTVDYNKFIAEFKRILTGAGKLVLLSGLPDVLEAACVQAELSIDRKITLSLFGKHPVIFICTLR